MWLQMVTKGASLVMRCNPFCQEGASNGRSIVIVAVFVRSEWPKG